MFSPISNHVQQALDRLMTQYKNSGNLKGFITAVVQPIQIIEEALTGMNNLRYLEDAVGVQLDVIGIIVGLKRAAGLSDDIYRQQLSGQIKINVSQGQPEQAIQTFQLFTGANLVILSEYVASVLLSSDWLPPDQTTVDAIIKILEQVLPAGVRPDGIISFDNDMAFAYDGSLPGLGYDDGSQTVGGKYAQLWLYLGPGFAYAGDDSSGEGYGTNFDPLAGGAYLT